MRIPPFIWVVCTVLFVLMMFAMCNEREGPRPYSTRTYSSVGVGRSRVQAKIDLTDKLNPAILPEVLKEVLKEMAPNQKPDSEKFQQEVVQKLSQAIMDDPEVNYRVDLNDDKNLDPVLVVPESVGGEAAVYSIRVPDPQKYTKDPPPDSDWHKIAEGGLELVALSITFDQTSQKMTVSAQSNEYLYEGEPRYYRSEYDGQHHSWMESYFKYMILRDILFRPYGWYGSGWYGGWYGGYYGGWHRPGLYNTRTRRRTVTRTRYKTARSATGPARTASGKSATSKKSASRSARKQAPKSIQAMKSKRSMQARKASSTRSGGFGRRSGASRSRSTSRTSGYRTRTPSRSYGRSRRSYSSFRGGGFRFGK